MARITPDIPQRGAARNLLNVVDNYYRPARDRVGEAAMSEGFNAASNYFGNKAAEAKKQQLAEISMQAKNDAMMGDDPDVELSKVRNGLLFRSNSRAYNQTYAETMGQKAAIEFKENLSLEYEQSGLKYKTDPAAFREWMNGQVTTFLKDGNNQSPYFLAGAMPYIEQTTFNMGAAHTANISKQMETNHIAAITKKAEDTMLKVGTGEITIDGAIQEIVKLNNQAYGTGLDGPTSRAALLSSFLSVADATDNQEMITALLSAQESGQLKLTPDEWNNITKQGEGIQRDIAFRQQQKSRATTKLKEGQEKQFEELVTDFYNNPANIGSSFEQFLQQPMGDTGQTMAEVINASPNSTSILKKAKEAYTTVNTIYEVSKNQELSNNHAITDAFDNGKINSKSDLLSFMNTAQKDGFRFNEANFTHAFKELEKREDPEGVYKTQTYKDYKVPTVNRIIGALTPDSGELSFSFEGEYQGGMADDIKMRFQTYLDEELAQAGSVSPEAVKAAIQKAEASTMDFYKQNDPALFDNQFGAFSKAVEDGKVSWTSNPYFAKEASALAEEQQTLAAEQEAQIRTARQLNSAFTRPDLDIQAGNAILDGVTGDELVVTQGTIPLNAEQIAIQEQISEADAAAQVVKDQKAEAERVEAERVEADRLAVEAADNKLMDEAAETVEKLNDIVVDEVDPVVFDDMLVDLQEKYNITVPTNIQEVQFLIEDIRALQEETKLTLDEDVVKQLIGAAIRSYRK